MTSKNSLTVLFEPPFWVGIYERIEDGRYQVCKITFGAEPKDCEVYAFLLKDWHRLRLSQPVGAGHRPEKKVNPKRMQREIHSQLNPSGMGTKAQQALKLQQEQRKQARKGKDRVRKEREQEVRYALRQEKKKAKRRGR